MVFFFRLICYFDDREAKQHGHINIKSESPAGKPQAATRPLGWATG
jgi:hypothetical protein